MHFWKFWQNFGTWGSWGDYGKSRFSESPKFSNYGFGGTIAKDTENLEIRMFEKCREILELGDIREIAENLDFRKILYVRILAFLGNLHRMRKIWIFAFF